MKGGRIRTRIRLFQLLELAKLRTDLGGQFRRGSCSCRDGGGGGSSSSSSRCTLGLLVFFIVLVGVAVLALPGLVLGFLVALVHGVGCGLGGPGATGFLAVVEGKGRFEDGRVGVGVAGSGVVVLGGVGGSLLGASRVRLAAPRGGFRRARCGASSGFDSLSCLLLASLFLGNGPIDGALEPLLVTHALLASAGDAKRETDGRERERERESGRRVISGGREREIARKVRTGSNERGLVWGA
ncbi:hypothetical protein LY76DRAFT_206776 [Colletotrichum caudatum]|nr:hypothetical protein LY76DRAFT_206776 [Colletotrichum caudatum]